MSSFGFSGTNCAVLLGPSARTSDYTPDRAPKPAGLERLASIETDKGRVGSSEALDTDVAATVVRCVAGVLELPESTVGLDAHPIQSLGMDSLQCFDAADAVERALGRPVPSTLFLTEPTLQGVVDKLWDSRHTEPKASVDTSKPAICRHRKPGHFGVPRRS